MNIQSCQNDPDGPNSAGPMLRAGLTEVLVTGIDTRWIAVSTRPMARPAKPTGALMSVEPRIVSTRNEVITTSTRKQENQP